MKKVNENLEKMKRNKKVRNIQKLAKIITKKLSKSKKIDKNSEIKQKINFFKKILDKFPPPCYNGKK